MCQSGSLNTKKPPQKTISFFLGWSNREKTCIDHSVTTTESPCHVIDQPMGQCIDSIGFVLARLSASLPSLPSVGQIIGREMFEAFHVTHGRLG